MIRTLLDEVSERNHKATTKEDIYKLIWLYSHPVSKEMIYEFFDKRIWTCVSIQELSITDSGVKVPQKIFVFGAPYPFPADISQLITICTLENCLGQFDWNIDTKMEYDFV